LKLNLKLQIKYLKKKKLIFEPIALINFGHLLKKNHISGMRYKHGDDPLDMFLTKTAIELKTW
jgi:hypothetical protein